MRCTVDNPLAKARGLPLRTGAQPMLYLPLVAVAVLVVEVSSSSDSCTSDGSRNS